MQTYYRGVTADLSSLSSVSEPLPRALLFHRRDNRPRLITRFIDNDDDDDDDGVFDINVVSLLRTGVNKLTHTHTTPLLLAVEVSLVYHNQIHPVSE